ncbi:MAG TPA: hypothetical protein VL993_03270 [Stellaceae bacterium]|nr:hypothetical protein [Stellaceae bacterium]
MAERTTVRLPAELLSRAKRKAAAEGRTLTSLIADGLRQIVAGQTMQVKNRVMPRVSKARPGLMPGIDLEDLSTLQDREDRDYVRRMGSAR